MLAIFPAQAQVHTGDLTLSTQAQVDAFVYTEVTGTLRIQGSGITNLDGLNGLTSVGGALHITESHALTSLDALSGLTSVGRSLLISSNTALASLDGLSGPTSVGRSLLISSNTALASLDGLSSLTSVGGFVRIDYNDALSSCSCGIGALLASGGVSGTITIHTNLPGCNSPAEVLATPCARATRYVATTGNNTDNDCTDEATPCATLTHAVSQANAGDIIDVAAGVYTELGLVIDKALTLQGPGVIVQ